MKDNFVSPLCYGGCMCGQNGCPSCGSYAGLMEQTAELLQTLRSAMYPNSSDATWAMARAFATPLRTA